MGSWVKRRHDNRLSLRVCERIGDQSRTRDDRDVKWVSLDGHKIAQIIDPSSFLVDVG